MTDASELTTEQLDRLHFLSVPECSLAPAEYPVDAVLALCDLVRVIKVGDNEMTSATAAGMRLGIAHGRKS